LRHGKHIKTENVSVKGWQKRYGKAIGAKSPGFVQSELKLKAERAGGTFTKFSTQKTALSQTHLEGTRIKKSLSERVHKDVTGIPEHQRDLFSSFLIRHVNQDNMLSLQDALNEYPWAEPLMLEAWQRHITRKQVGESESRKADSPSERVSNEPPIVDQIAKPIRAKSQMRMWRESPKLDLGEGSKSLYSPIQLIFLAIKTSNYTQSP
jgi:putative transposase